MKFRTTASFGKRQEFVAMGELLKRGFDVYTTLVDDRQIDCIVRVRRNGKLHYLDIQIKARSKECKEYDAGRFAAMDIFNPRENYFFIFFSEHVNKYWIMPSLELVKIGSRNKKGKNVGKYHIMLTGFKKKKPYPLPKFKKYEDAFHLLR